MNTKWSSLLTAVIALTGLGSRLAWGHDPYEIISTASLYSNRMELKIEMEFRTTMLLTGAAPPAAANETPASVLAAALPGLREVAAHFFEIKDGRHNLTAQEVVVSLGVENHVQFHLSFPCPEGEPIGFQAQGLAVLDEQGPYGTSLTVLDMVRQKVVGQTVLFARSPLAAFTREAADGLTAPVRLPAHRLRPEAKTPGHRRAEQLQAPKPGGVGVRSRAGINAFRLGLLSLLLLWSLRSSRSRWKWQAGPGTLGTVEAVSDVQPPPAPPLKRGVNERAATRALILALCTFTSNAIAQRQLEMLGRGIVGIRQSSTQVYVGWRMLGTDPDDVAFNLYRVTSGLTNLLNGAPLTNSCNLVDTNAPQGLAHAYYVEAIFGAVVQAWSAPFSMPANAPVRAYVSIPLQRPPDGVAADGVPYTYSPNDCSVGDVDGDGEYELILKWDPSNSHDNSQSGFTGNVFLDAYKLDGTRLWRIDLGPNIRAGAHYTQFMVYDLDGDGRAEVACKTAPGTVDGLGNYVLMPGDNPGAVYTNSAGYILSGPEYFTIFNGLTGAAMATTNYVPARGTVSNWGDSYGNRVDRFLACVAYLDGVRPSVVMCRGYYTRACLAAWDWRGGRLTQRWVFDTGFSGGPWAAWKGQGAHSLTVGDVDGDGKDEIIYGAAAIDDNGTGLYSTMLGHGDALHMSVMDPARPGQEVWMVHEDPGSYGPTGLEFREAKTGALIFGLDGQNADVGRGVAMDLDPRYQGYEMWGARGGLMSATGVQISSGRPSSMNFACWWDADLLREILDGTTISKWDYNAGVANAILAPGGIASNNSTKSTPCLSADLFGDWREEVIWRSSANDELRIYTATTPATNRFYTLMHDSQYRLAIAWQNVGYNQPPHPGFYIGPGMAPPPPAQISTAHLAWRGAASDNTWDATISSNWFLNGVWTNAIASIFGPGDTVLFDLRGSNTLPVNLVGALAPGKVTVFSAKDYVFAGNGSLIGMMPLSKAGPARLTINTTNTYTGATTVSGGSLYVNGALDNSPVTVENRGATEGPARVGGNGRFGQGLTVQTGCGVVVGEGTNQPGTLVVSNALIELGSVLNQFDLSSDPTGLTNANDAINVAGNLSFSGTNTIQITQLDGFLGGGVYPLFRYSGVLTGGLANLVLAGSFIQPVMLTNPPGQIGLLAVVPGAPPATPGGLVAVAIGAFQINLAWTRNSNDENNTLIERSTDNVTFTQIAILGAGANSYADIGLSPNGTYYYRVRASNLAGASGYSNTAHATTPATPPLLVWRGDGLANVWDIAGVSNWVNGSSRTFYGDGAFATFDSSGSNSPAINLATNLQPGAVIVNASKNYTFGGLGSLRGTMTLTKSGSGTLTLTTTNTYTGGTSISNGTVVLGSTGANYAALGGGAVTFYGGTLEFTGFGGSTSPDYGGNTNALIIPAGQTGTIRVPQRFASPGLNGRLSGTGTLNLVVNYVRGDISGNWTSFTGRIMVSNSGTDVDDLRILNALGFPNARLSLATNLLMYSRAAANSVIPIGEFSSAAGAVVSAGFGSSAGVQNAVTWRVGALDTDATNAALIQGTTSLIKEGTGKWTLTGANTYSGTTTVNGGSLLINGDQSTATGAVNVGSGGTLGGQGTVGGATTISGRLAPGDGLGTLTFDGNLALAPGSSSVFELSRSPFANDVARVFGTVTFGGTLSVVNVSPDLLEEGDTFQLFDAANSAGSFASLNLPSLDAGLAWDTSALLSAGVIKVVGLTAPQFGAVVLSGQNLLLSGSGGTPNGPYYLLASTNLNLPLPAWTRLVTNLFDSAGDFAVTNTLNPGNPQLFYRLRLH